MATRFVETDIQVCLAGSGGYHYEEDTQNLHAGQTFATAARARSET